MIISMETKKEIKTKFWSINLDIDTSIRDLGNPVKIKYGNARLANMAITIAECDDLIEALQRTIAEYDRAINEHNIVKTVLLETPLLTGNIQFADDKESKG